MNQKPKVIQVGGVAWNTMVFLTNPLTAVQGSGAAERWHQALGSTGAGKALNMQRLGFDVSLHSLLGSDDVADKIRLELEVAGIQCHWQRYSGASEQHLNLMSPGGERQSIFLEQEPDLQLRVCDGLALAWQEADYHWINIKAYCRRLLPALQSLGQPIWCDLHDYDENNPYHQPFIRAADYLMASAEALSDPLGFMSQQIDAGKQVVIVTDGAGSIGAMDLQGRYYQVDPIRNIALVDSNGAGDAFSAGFLYGWHQGRPMEVCLQLGACAGAICIGSPLLAEQAMDSTHLESWWQRHYG